MRNLSRQSLCWNQSTFLCRITKSQTNLRQKHICKSAQNNQKADQSAPNAQNSQNLDQSAPKAYLQQHICKSAQNYHKEDQSAPKAYIICKIVFLRAEIIV